VTGRARGRPSHCCILELALVLTFESDERKWLTHLREFVSRWNSTDDYLGDNPFSKFIFAARADSWNDFTQWHESLNENWGFRGQQRYEWFLHSSLDRAVEVSGRGLDFTFVTHLDRRATEDRLLFKFKQRAHQYLRHLPNDHDLVSWLALMQHHGVPTRLLDWTRSPYVAAYFAFEAASAQPCAIWALDLDWLKCRGGRLLQSAGKGTIPDKASDRASYLNDLLSQPEDPEENPAKDAMIVEVEPTRTDAWMTSQQGFFLCKRYPRATFNQLLMSMMIHPEVIEAPTIRKLQLGADLRIEFLKKLRSANVHRGSLFPDLDGFSQFLRMDWEIDRDHVGQQMEHTTEPPQGDPDESTIVD
jgi:hypothetical protein